MKVLFVSPGLIGKFRGTGKLASFHQTDLRILEEMGADVRSILWYGRPLGRLLRDARWADVVYCWSIGDHAFAASFVAKRLACAVGGFEFASLPEVHYGSMLSFRTRFITRRTWQRADALLYVDASLALEATRAFGHPGNAYIVPTAYDPNFWTPGPGDRQPLVVTVCHAPNLDRLRLKGVDVFLETARLCPDLEFRVAGEIPDGLDTRSFAPNVTFDGWMEPTELRALYQRAKVYCQLSLHEGLPNSVCEAMLCGCVPIGTSVNGIPTAIGDAGYIVDRDPHAVVEAIRRAIVDRDAPSRARERIASRFTNERRREAMQEIFETLAA